MSTIKAVVQSRAGDPTEVLDVADVEAPPPPGPGQVTIAVTRFPVHPGDLQTIAATRPDGGHPAAVGAEATGVITAAGPGVDLPVGTRVAAFFVGGAWRQQITVGADVVVAVPDALTEDVAAQMLINPITVLMLRRAAQQHHSVGFDGVILNNGAASSVGRLFTAGAQHHQIATISIVRSAARADELSRRFPDVPVVSTHTADWKDQVRAAVAGRPIAVALDPIGGTASADLLTLLDPGGSLVLYGLMAPEQIPLHASTLVHRDLTIRGLTIGRWALSSAEQKKSDLASAAAISQGLASHFDVAAIYPIDRIRDAAAHAARSGKTGTILVDATSGATP
ncbi:zinc-binding dehydrogenase [Mycolicibacterium sp. P9-64]|uniref:zinc-binding dehydrogenase n=1 Tax=Mycolicibacterium sp. P9-64 TaxID=2024612 RepID=UPI0018D72317|nr:zinc-binding dehydrogenase [Mycolicibacterium sp. P9-64]